MIRIIYHSVSRVLEGSSDALFALAMILDEALVYNSRNRLTGVLAFRDGQFVQVLEGPEEAVDDLFHRILIDRRHHTVRLLSRETCDDRLFDGWSMGYIGREHDLSEVFTTARAARSVSQPREMVRSMALLLA